MFEQTLTGKWQFRQAGDLNWLPAQVPGGVHTDLLSAGLIPDPFEGDNENAVQWVAESDWEYRRIFNVDPQLLAEARQFLVCDGLDTLASVQLNGQMVGRAENMFRKYRWEVTNLLKLGENEILITFASPSRFVMEHDKIRRLPGTNDTNIPGAPYLRKAPCHFGWDWGPKLPAIGIWKDIRLEGGSIARLEDIQIRQVHANGQVTLLLKVTPERWSPAEVFLTVTLTDPQGETTTLHASHQTLTNEFQIPVENPQLWWPNGYGSQPLYQLHVSLLSSGRSLDERNYQVGLRTLELCQLPDTYGVSFTFIVNDVPIFAKGANWIPADSFPTRITPQKLEYLIKSSAKVNINMLRVWGGGYYESDAFFDLCDQYGILIWHDFMFACAAYTFTPAFSENVHQEVIDNIRRLRHHPCLALWCGNNEMESGWVHWGWNTPLNADLKASDRQFFYQTLPAWVQAEDPNHPYWPSSPSSHTPHEIPNSDAAGDNHVWEVWHGLQPFSYYRTRFPRFASEFGFQSLPDLETIKTYAPTSEWNMNSYIMELHQRSPRGNGLIVAYMTDHFRLPKDFESLVYLSQVQQAEAMRTAVEHWRRNRERCSGTLYWQLNDCWPVASWSSIDYYGRWKALQYVARRFYTPLLLSAENNGPLINLYLTNDQTTAWQGEIHWALETFDGEPLLTGSQVALAAPLSTTPVISFDCSPYLNPQLQRNAILVCELWKEHQRLSLTAIPFLPDKYLLLQDPEFSIETKVESGLLYTQLQANSLARFVEFRLEGELKPGEGIFSDNYFDLPAHRLLTVTCPIPSGWTPGQSQGALRVRSLVQTYT